MHEASREIGAKYLDYAIILYHLRVIYYIMDYGWNLFIPLVCY